MVHLGLLTTKKCLCLFAPCAERFARCYMSFSCHFRTLLFFTCSDNRFLLLARGTNPRLRILRYVPSSFWVRPPLNVMVMLDESLRVDLREYGSPLSCSCFSFFHGWWSLLSHSCFTHFWHSFLGCRSRQLLVSLFFVCTLRSRGASLCTEL